MKLSGIVFIAVLSPAILVTGCDRHETPVENAVEQTKDALDMREHEKLKDAAESAGEAIDDAVQGVEDEANRK